MNKFEHEKVREMVKKRGLKLGWVAREIGVHPTTLSRWLNGHSVPEATSLMAIARLLEMRPEDLIAS